MFAEELSDSQMKAYTNCKEFLKGDLLSWNVIPWVLAGNRKVSELEYLDLQKEICTPQESSLILVPFPLKKEPFGEQMCSKMSSIVASYTSDQDLEFIVKFLANKNNLIENGCIKKVSETENEYLITSGVDGKLNGGKFLNPSKGTPVVYFPWVNTHYSCILMRNRRGGLG